MSRAYLSLILHAHLPFVRHKEKGQIAEEWLFEAITETYIPLLNIMEKLLRDKIYFRLSIDISPSLASMLADNLLQKKYKKHLENLIELSEKEIHRLKNNEEIKKLAEMYRCLFKEAYYVFHEKYNDNLLNGFKRFQDEGSLEIITSAATHAYLPLIYKKETISAQIKTGIKTYKHFFNQEPPGIWLPECGFKENIEAILAREKIRYFISSSHGLLYAIPRPRYGLFAPVYTPNGVAVFGRDLESSKQVWSADEGYPGDFDYREFYRDIAYDLNYDYIKKYLPSGIRKHTGIKYYKITGKTDNKELYNPDRARKKAAEHAANFAFNRQQQFFYLNNIMDRNPIIIAPYDAELFGHWWFEGPLWLEYLFKKLHYDIKEVLPITPQEYLEKYPGNQVAMPAESSWGYKGYHEVWLNESNDWIYRHLHEAEKEMAKEVSKYQNNNDDEIIERALKQLARELFLAQSSDWAFIMKTKTMVDYAEKRTKTHLNNFFKLIKQLQENNINERYLHELEEENNIFPFIDYRDFIPEKDGNLLLRKEG